MPQVNTGRTTVSQAGKSTGKRRVKRVKAREAAKPQPTVVAPADRVGERTEARKVQIKNSVSKSPDRQDTKRSPAQKQRDAKVVAANVRSSRLKVVTKRGRGAGVRAVKNELEGKGILAKIAGAAGDRAVKNTTTLPGGASKMGGVSGSGASRLVGRATKDALNLPAQAVPSLYVPIAGAVEAVKGKPQRLKQLAKDIDQHDPAYNLGAAAVEKLTGDNAAAKKRLKRAKDSASEHPGFAIAEAVGVRGTAGRGVGAAARTGALGKTVKRAASTERAPRVLEGSGLREERAYSKDPVQKAVQVHRERTGREKAAGHRAAAARTEDVNQRVEFERKARAVDPDTFRDRDIARRVDEHVDAVESVRRTHRSEVTVRTGKTARKVRKAGPVPNLLAQRIVKPDVADLRAYVRELEGEHAALGPAAKRANEQLRHKLTRAIGKAERGKLNLNAVKAQVDVYARESREGQAGLVKRGMLDAEQAERASVTPYAVRRMGAKHDGEKLTVGGTPLSTAAVRAHMQAAGEEPPAFISQAPNSRGAKNFYVNASRAPQATGARRTGEATRKGTFDAHPDTLTEAAARTQGLTDAFDHFQEFVREFGYRDPKGRGGVKTRRTKRDADNLARDLSAGETEWRAVRVNPFGASKEQLAQMLDGLKDDKPLHDAVEKALDGDDGEGPWAIVPKAAADRMQEHLRALNPGNAGRVTRQVNSTFRKTVLATSLPWLVGNVTEAALRTALAKAGPRSYVTGRRVLKRASELDPKMAEMTQARTVGGGHFGFADRQHVHTDLAQFRDGVVKDVARPLAAFWHAPGPKHVAAVWNGWTHGVFQVVNKAVEQQFQVAMLGKAVRDSPLMTDRALKLSRAATDKAAKGILDQNTAVALGREVDRMYGQYGKYSPDMRKALALYTPFAAWTLNAATFVIKTLPRDHPTALALTASMVNVTDEWRKEHGLDKFMQGAAPGWLQGSIPGKGGARYRAPTRYTPFGLFTDPLGSTAGAVLPQAQGVLSAFKGQDWKGDKLRGPDGSELDDFGKARAAAKAFAESTVPGLALAGRVKKKGAKVAVLDATIGKTAPAPSDDAPTAGPSLKVKRGSFGKSSYGSGSFGSSSYGKSSFK